MSSSTSAVCWVGAYLALILAPLCVLLIGPVPPGSGFWWDLSMALGFAGMAVIGVQFLLTARFRRACAPFGIDIIFYFHRYLALLAGALLLAHLLILRSGYVEALGPLHPLHAPWHMTAGRAALVLIAVLIGTSLWRKRLRIHYDAWRLLHIGLSVAAYVLALGHIEGVGYYIEAPAKRWLWTGYTLFWLLLVVYVRVVKPWRMRTRPYRVTEVRREHGRAWTLALEPDGHPGLRFEPGQFAWLTLRASPWHIKEHPFSIASSAEHPDRLEFTIKELGDFTRTIRETQVGEVAYLDGPYGAFSVDRYPQAPGFVFIAGGIGIAPIISMLRTLADRGERRPLLLLYGNKCWDEVILREQLDALSERLDLRLVHVLADPPADWEGESGFVTPELLERALPARAQALEYFLCGPKPMSDAVQQALHGLGVPLGRVHSELFDMV